MTQLDAAEVARIRFRHGLQQRSDKGTYWVHPQFADSLLITLDEQGRWRNTLAKGPQEARKEEALTYGNDSLDGLDQYLYDFINTAQSAQLRMIIE